MVTSVLTPHIMVDTQECNKVDGGRKRLCGDKSRQSIIVLSLAQMLSRGEVDALTEHPQMGFLSRRIANHMLISIGENVGVESILAACGLVGVSNIGYGQIFKIIKGCVELINKDLKASFLPNPYKVCESNIDGVSNFVEIHMEFFIQRLTHDDIEMMARWLCFAVS